MYPVDVICLGCPATLGGTAGSGDEEHFAPAAIERVATEPEWPATDRLAGPGRSSTQ